MGKGKKPLRSLTVFMAKLETAVFGAGCFWGVEETFRTTNGVVNTTVGYAGGTTQNPSYEDVCSHATGHAEVVQVEFDPKVISFKELLEVFWNCHDATQVNRQGPDVGDNYRSIILYTSEAQRKAAEALKKAQEKKLGKKVATEIKKLEKFWKAEDYHQKYILRTGRKVC